MASKDSYPPIGDYALIADSNSVALVSHDGSMDWCCIQRIDAGSCFGRLLDREKGGFCSITPVNNSQEPSRSYVDDSLVLETMFHAEGGEARLYDCFTLPASEEMYPQRQIIRVIEGVSGHVELDLKIEPRFDYGSLKPWIRQEGVRIYSAIGGNDGLLISCDAEISPTGNHGLEARVSVH
ncbi:MAG: trehalase-like domain-containing protein, partial [Rubrobacteraceae bacterium]